MLLHNDQGRSPFKHIISQEIYFLKKLFKKPGGVS